MLPAACARARVRCASATACSRTPRWDRSSTAAALERIRGYIDDGVASGAQLLVDGRRHPASGAPFAVARPREGFFIGATLFDHVTPQMRIYREEIFGPVLCLRARAGLRGRGRTW